MNNGVLVAARAWGSLEGKRSRGDCEFGEPWLLRGGEHGEEAGKGFEGNESGFH